MKRPIRRSRMFGWDRNPLRRRIDRIEGGVIAGLIVLFLIAAPVLAMVAGNWTRTAGLRQQRVEATWSQVSATVPRGSSPQQDFSSGAAATVRILARWTAPDGQPRSGWLRSARGPCPAAPCACGSTARARRPDRRSGRCSFKGGLLSPRCSQRACWYSFSRSSAVPDDTCSANAASPTGTWRGARGATADPAALNSTRPAVRYEKKHRADQEVFFRDGTKRG